MRILVLIPVLLLLSVLGTQQAAASEAEPHFRRAEQLQLAAKHREAAAAYRQVIEGHRLDLDWSAPALINVLACLQADGSPAAQQQLAAARQRYLGGAEGELDQDAAREALLWQPWPHARITIQAQRKPVRTVLAQLRTQVATPFLFEPREMKEHALAMVRQLLSEPEKLQDEPGSEAFLRLHQLQLAQAPWQQLANPLISVEWQDATLEQVAKDLREQAGYIFLAMPHDDSWWCTNTQAISFLWGQPMPDQPGMLEELENSSQRRYADLEQGASLEWRISQLKAQNTRTEQGLQHHVQLELAPRFPLQAETELTAGMITVSTADGRTITVRAGEPNGVGHLSWHRESLSLSLRSEQALVGPLTIAGQLSLSQAKTWQRLELPLREGAEVAAGDRSFRLISSQQRGRAPVITVQEREPKNERKGGSHSSSSSSTDEITDTPYRLVSAAREHGPLSIQSSGADGRSQVILSFPAVKEPRALSVRVVAERSTRELAIAIAEVELP